MRRLRAWFRELRGELTGDAHLTRAHRFATLREGVKHAMHPDHTITLDDLATPGGLSEALERTGVSGRELARRLDVPPKWVNRRVRGESPITLDQARRILAALNQ